MVDIYIYIIAGKGLVKVGEMFTTFNWKLKWFIYLVGGEWLPSMFYFPRNIGLLIIPIDELIFFRGVAQPPTSYYLQSLHIYIYIYRERERDREGERERDWHSDIDCSFACPKIVLFEVEWMLQSSPYRVRIYGSIGYNTRLSMDTFHGNVVRTCKTICFYILYTSNYISNYV